MISLALYSKHGSLPNTDPSVRKTTHVNARAINNLKLRIQKKKPIKNGKDRPREIAVDSEGTWGEADVTYFNCLKRSGNYTYRCNTCISSGLSNGNGLRSLEAGTALHIN